MNEGNYLAKHAVNAIKEIDLNTLIRVGTDFLQGKIDSVYILDKYGPQFVEAVEEYAKSFDIKKSDLKSLARFFGGTGDAITKIANIVIDVGGTQSIDLIPAIKNLAIDFCKGSIDAKTLMLNLGQIGIQQLAFSAAQAYGDDFVEIENNLAELKTVNGYAIAYAASCEAYEMLMKALNDSFIQHEHMLQVEEECKESIRMITEYRQQMQEKISLFFEKHFVAFEKGFSLMDKAILESDSNGYIRGNTEIQKVLGYDSQFTNQEEFDELMDSDTSFRL